MDELKALRYFSKVVETGSFTKAASVFDVPPSSLSRRVANLEASLGATLLKRSTRVVQVTEIGLLYHQQVQEILLQIEQSNETVRSYHAKPIGRLRISSMVSFGEGILLPLMEDFKQEYPDIVLDISLSDELTALGRDDVDIAIRGGYPPNERIQALRLMDNEFVPAAAPGYLKVHGSPKSAFDLRQHKGLFFRTPTGPSPWLCESDGEWHDVSGETIAVSNNAPWLGRQALAAKGIILAPAWSLADYLDSGKLVKLDLSPAPRVSQNSNLAIYLLYQKQRYLVPKVKVAVDFLVARCR
ncbi:LysR family transcriptional regulator [Chromatocurvus halotolerans]|uniref:LysR family transcriptional regulator n=1 Tax=Chromatocurvus halotolerans TaxID=1132028 RepID=A0A4R2KPQ5_9GAMM|nr:LysR family transcriptional regulator [Chromatocurvus halotolerans]TCO75554.1 LysR family transcriptional regulator [Chromatocurvus halotolerans]